MKDYRFKSFDDDVEIWAIGSLFRWISGKQWNVGLQLTPSQRRNYLSISNAPCAFPRNSDHWLRWNLRP